MLQPQLPWQARRPCAGCARAACRRSHPQGLPHRVTRWRQTSRREAVAAEQKLLARCSGQYSVSDVRVGPTEAHTMHTITGGPAGGTPVVMLPGYGAGAGFFWK